MTTVFTIGHSTRPAAELVSVLSDAGVAWVLDVRRYPSSRRHPQFNREALATALREAGIEYRHLPELGGRREPLPDSPNTGWREAGFRGYADHMGTEPFRLALTELSALAATEPCALLCAEADWRNCHRGLIADALKLRGFDVVHLTDAGRREPHPWTAPARVVDGQLSYAPELAQRSLDL